jgi:hypothetical protein
MRLEGQDRGGRAPRPPFPDRRLDQGAMAAVDPVEVADRQDRAAQGRRHGLAVAADCEGARRLVRLVGCGHRSWCGGIRDEAQPVSKTFSGVK